MEILNVLLEYMKFEDRNINELIELSSLIDGEKNTNGILMERDDDIAVIASVIVALINEKSTMKMGEKILNDLNAVIVKKNLNLVELNNGKELYEQLQEKELPGTFKIKTTPTGYKFDFVAADGEVLAVSELYSKLESCLNGIMSVQKNSTGEIEDQTEEIINLKKNPKFEMYLGGRYIGSINKEFTFFKPKFNIDCNGWTVDGDWFEWDYTILNAQSQQIASVSKEIWNWTDTYVIDVTNPQDALCALMLVLAIDAEKCSRQD